MVERQKRPSAIQLIRTYVHGDEGSIADGYGTLLEEGEIMANEGGTWIMYGVSEDDPECIHTVDEAIDFINEVGFLPLFKNEIPGFSLEERTVPDYWWSGDIKRDPWEWRALIARSGQVAYGKFFDKKAGFISKKWLPVFANYRREGYDFDALWDDEKASMRQKKIMDLFMEDNADAEWYSFEVKQNAGFGKGSSETGSKSKGEGGERNFDGTVTDLEMRLYLCNRDFRQRKNKKGESYGWAIAVYCTPEHLFGYECVTSNYKESADTSWGRIIDHMHDRYPIATDAQLNRVLGIAKMGTTGARRKSNRTEPKDWLVPANPKFYDVVDAFEKANIIGWKQSSDIHVGDMVYLYVGAPYSSILYKCKAIEVDIPHEYTDDNISMKFMMKIQLIQKYDPGVWSFNRIKDYGVNAVRGPRSLPKVLKEAMDQ